MRFNSLIGFEPWTYSIHEIASGIEQVDLYRGPNLRFTAPITLPQEKMQQFLLDTAAKMEFDIQRRFSQWLYGFDVVRAEIGVLADMANGRIRRFLAQHAVSLKHLGVSDCGITRNDVHGFLEVLEEEERQVLEVVKYLETLGSTAVANGEMWRIGDMRTPTPFLLKKNLALVRDSFFAQRTDYEQEAIYSFVIDSREVVKEPDAAHSL